MRWGYEDGASRAKGGNRLARMTRCVAAVSVALVLGGCVGGSKDTTKEDKARLKPFILSKAPGLENKLNINYDDKVKLLGYKIEPRGPIAPGQKVKVTMYWRCLKSPGKGWAAVYPCS